MVEHEYPEGFSGTDWMVPTSNGNAVIRHGHTNPTDHSACGPTLFCCTRAARLYSKAFPETPEAKAQWQIIDAGTITSWIEGGVKVAYFVFCDPLVETQLRAIGVTDPGVRDIVGKTVAIEDYGEDANVLEVLPSDDVIFKLLEDR